MASRTQNTTYNLAINIVSQVLAIIFSFVSRSVFIFTLDARYLGINGLFTNIISLLSLAELGVGTALIFSMYQPLACHDTKKLAALTQFYKKLYRSIGFIIAGIGLLLFPFLDFFINLEIGIPHVQYYYLLFLLQSVCSYFMVYKTSIMTADQKGYILQRNSMIINSIATFTQIIVLLIWKNYVIYLFVIVFFNIGGNYYNSKIAEKKYPYIKEKIKLDEVEKKQIWSNIMSMFLYKLGGIILNNTDNILISKLIGTIEVGYYSNYNLIINKVGNITALFFTSIQASLGNLNVDADENKKKFIFDVLNLVSFWIYGFSSICFCLLLQDFILLWIGEEYLFDEITMYICVANFYLQGVLYPIWCFRNTTGLFKDTKYTMLIASIINIVASIMMGLRWGITGIFAATILSRIVTNIWYDPYKLFHSYFHSSVRQYYFGEITKVLFLIIFVAFSQRLFFLSGFSNGWFCFSLKMIYCIISVNVLFFLHFRKKDTFEFICNKMVQLVKNRIRK